MQSASGSDLGTAGPLGGRASAELRAAVQSASDPMRVMQRIVDGAVRIVPASDGAAVELVDTDGLTCALRCVACAGRSVPSVGLRLEVRKRVERAIAETAFTIVFQPIFDLRTGEVHAALSSFTHIVRLAPDVIKLDLCFTRGVDVDPVRRSLATAVVAFARDTQAVVVAEGIETESELDTLWRLGVGYGQGYLLGKPGPHAALEEASRIWGPRLAHLTVPRERTLRGEI